MRNTKDKYLLSVIIPVYNVESYIEETLLSVLAQMTDEVELLIIDDGSTDKTAEVANKIIQKSQQRARLISIPNGGVSAARNLGVARARGRYLIFVDGDDLMVQGAIARILKKVRDNSVDVICGGAFTFDKTPDAHRMIGCMLDNAGIKTLEGLSGHAAYAMLLASGAFNPGVWANIFRRSMVADTKFDTTMANNEDVDYVMRLFLDSTSFTALDSPHYLYRKFRLGSASNLYTPKRIESSLRFVDKWQVILRNLTNDSPVRDLLKDYIAYQYAILVGSLYAMKPNKRRALETSIRIRKDLFNSKGSLKTKTVYYLYRIFGFKITGYALAIFIKTKEFRSA